MPGGRPLRKLEAKLARRQADFDSLKSNQGRKRPGSQQRKRQK